MENCIGPVWDLIKLMWAPVGRRIQLARRLGEKIENLDAEARYLSNRRQDIERELSSDDDKVPNAVFKGWIDDVEKIEQRRREIKDEYAQNKKCLLGLFPDIKWRMSLGKCIEEAVVRIGELQEMSKFEGGIVLDAPPPAAEFLQLPRTMEPAPINRTLQKVLAHIRSEKIHQIGIWGMGGVGKTTVLKALNNLSEISITFEIVIWVTVSSQGSVEKIQKDVAKRLSVDVNDADPIHTVANKIYQNLRSKKFLLLLDDVWRSLDLGDIGIPNLNEQEKEGLTGGAKSIIDGYNKGRDLLNTLVQKSLLEKVGYSRCRMHDLLRDLALIITSPRGNNDNKFLVRAGLRDGWYGNEEEWKRMKRISLMSNALGTLPESLDCPILSTLFLQHNLRLQTIPNKFFQHLAELRVLDLSYTSIRSLPSSISSLVNLQGLYLNNSEALAELPSEVGSLKKLEELQMIAVAVQRLPFDIMNLNRLISFIFSTAYHLITTVDIPAGVIKSLISLEQLQIGVKLLQSAHVAMLDEVACLRNLTKIRLSFPKASEFVMVWSCDDIEILANGDESEGGDILADLENLKLSCLPKLRAIIEGQPSIRSFSNLNSLRLDTFTCDRLEDIFEENEIEPEMIRSDGHQLPRLELLELQSLPKLVSIDKIVSLASASIEEIWIRKCINVKSLPSSLVDAPKLRKIGGSSSEWWDEELEWEDNAIKHRLQLLLSVR
ncbi:unnamed protein product [Dovyalis caffra]|uniref:AAA+ ATPase domain-containing protein n=1 Tax=Dovyalis caffra TaxID=77055 RepID=A0AAV1S2W3_9ROSI|nr:unnamed protein product [Dovyalis caffra]